LPASPQGSNLGNFARKDGNYNREEDFNRTWRWIECLEGELDKVKAKLFQFSRDTIKHEQIVIDNIEPAPDQLDNSDTEDNRLGDDTYILETTPSAFNNLL